MNTLLIQSTSNSPEVSLNAETGKIIFSGRSYPDHGILFYEQIINWLKQYALSPATTTECLFRIEYLNSSSRKCMIEILKILESINMRTFPVTIIWNYEVDDDCMKEIGEEYKNMFKLNFQVNPF